MSDRLAHNMYYNDRRTMRNNALSEAKSIQDRMNQLVYYIEGRMSPATLLGTARAITEEMADLYAALARLEQAHQLEYLTNGTVDE